MAVWAKEVKYLGQWGARVCANTRSHLETVLTAKRIINSEYFMSSRKENCNMKHVLAL